MVPSYQTQLSRVNACQADLLDNGIDLARGDCRARCRVVRRHLDYLQLMLGWHADLREIVGLFGSSTGTPAQVVVQERA